MKSFTLIEENEEGIVNAQEFGSIEEALRFYESLTNHKNDFSIICSSTKDSDVEYKLKITLEG